MCWTNTFNLFLSPDDLAALIDEDPDEVRRVLRVSGVGARRVRRNENYTLFLRAHGMVGRTFRNHTHWCLLGMGAIQMTLRETGHLHYVMFEQPKGPFL